MNQLDEVLIRLSEIEKKISNIYEILYHQDVYKAGNDSAYKSFIRREGEKKRSLIKKRTFI